MSAGPMEDQMTTVSRTDPITTEIIRNACLACAQDMNETLIRSAHSPIIYEGKDCSAALLDEHGDVLGQSMGLPIFLGNLERCVKITAERRGWEAFRPGDVFLLNDAYLAGTHLHDATIFAPIFWCERLVGFSATRAHWLDVGSQDPGGSMSAREIYQEGIRVSPVRIYDRGEPCTDMIDLLALNSRFGDGLVGDLNAQVAACRTGEAGFSRILDRYGYDAFTAARDEFFRQSEALERAAVAAIPDGTYRAEGLLDDDGHGQGPLPVQVRITIEGDRMAIDLTGTSPQIQGPANVSYDGTLAGCRVAFKLLVHPERAVDGGTFRTLAVEVPPGTICSAVEPAPCHFYFTPLGMVIDLVITALAPVLPQAAAAAHYGDSMIMRISGQDPASGRRFLMSGPHPGGWGAWHDGDGADALINNINGAFKDFPVEVAERKYPVMVRRYGLRTDTAGAGAFRGGCGIARAIEVLAPAEVYSWFERSVTPAWGLFGGGPGAGPDVVIDPDGPNERHFLKANAVPIAAGEIVELRTGGGGGWGQAWERDPARVRDDVLDGYVSRAAAAEQYGVVFDDGGAIDAAATSAARERLRSRAAQG
jgi:N-methylhydantoinase B